MSNCNGGAGGLPFRRVRGEDDDDGNIRREPIWRVPNRTNKVIRDSRAFHYDDSSADLAVTSAEIIVNHNSHLGPRTISGLRWEGEFISQLFQNADDIGYDLCNRMGWCIVIAESIQDAKDRAGWTSIPSQNNDLRSSGGTTSIITSHTFSTLGNAIRKPAAGGYTPYFPNPGCRYFAGKTKATYRLQSGEHLYAVWIMIQIHDSKDATSHQSIDWQVQFFEEL